LLAATTPPLENILAAPTVMLFGPNFTSGYCWVFLHQVPSSVVDNDDSNMNLTSALHTPNM